MEAQALQSLWFWILVVVFGVYCVLDGFDLGVGTVIPFRRRSDERARLMGLLSPFWNGHEVLLLIGFASLFVLFAQAFTVVLTGFSSVMALLAIALVVRGVAFEFRRRSVRQKVLWERVFALASMLLVLLLCIALGNVIYGVPLTADRQFAGTFLTLVRPYPLLCGLLGVAVTVLQGTAYVSNRLELPVAQSMLPAGVWAWAAVVLLFIAFSLYTAFGIEDVATLPAFWGCAFLCIALLAGVRHAIRVANTRRFFLLTSAFVAGVWLVIGATQYPVLVRDSAAGAHITVFDSVAGTGTLEVATVLALVSVVVISGFTAYVYRVVRGTVKQNEGR